MQVKELMKQPYVVEEDIGLVDAAKIMSSKGIGSLLLVSKGKAKGIITEGDLLKNFGRRRKISQVMSKDIITLFSEETVEEAVRIMKKNKIKRLPIVDNKKRLVGIISMTDIAANIDKLEGEFLFN